MTPLVLVQTTGMAIDMARQMVLSDTIDREALLQKLNEARDCANAMEAIINPPKEDIKTTTLRKEVCKAFGISEDEIFQRTRKKEIINARQVYVFCVMRTRIPGKTPEFKMIGPSAVESYIGWDHATHITNCKTVQKYIDTEKAYREIIPRLQEGLEKGLLTIPEFPDLVKPEVSVKG